VRVALICSLSRPLETCRARAISGVRGVDSPLQLKPIAGLCRDMHLWTHDPATDLVSRILHRERRWEPCETRVLLACLTPGAVCVDAGANLGYFSVALALATVPVARVLAFEPAADNFDLLARNAELNGCGRTLEAYPLALGEVARTAELYRSADNLGDHQLCSLDRGRTREAVRVEVGDPFLGARVDQLNVVKIDTQGTEASVVRGMMSLLRASREQLHLLVELTPFALRTAGSSGRELVSLLAELDLPMAIVDHLEDRIVPETPEALARWCDNVDATEGDEGFMNIFVGAIPKTLVGG